MASPAFTLGGMVSTAIPRQSLVSAVAGKLRDKIIAGDLVGGDQLRQDMIADEFQVSRIPVREALRELAAEGLIELHPNRGAVVSILSPDQIEELFAVRAVLECEVLRQSIPRLSEEALAEAACLHTEFEARLGDPQAMSQWGALNSQFHAALYAGAELPQFKAILRNVNNNGDRYTRMQLFVTQGRERAIEEHGQLLALARRRETEAAVVLLNRHIRHAGSSLRRLLEMRRTAAAVGGT